MSIDSLPLAPFKHVLLPLLLWRRGPGRGGPYLSHLTHVTHLTFLTLVTLFFSGCATYKRSGLPPERARVVEQQFHPPSLSPELEDKILALDSLHVSEKDIREVLSHAPAPRIINIHGGIYPVHRRMISFSQFLIGMGYPAFSITNAADGTYTFSCYESSDLIA